MSDKELQEFFEGWGISSGVVTDFTLTPPLPVSGAQIYKREASIAWQAFRYGFNLANATPQAKAEILAAIRERE